MILTERMDIPATIPIQVPWQRTAGGVGGHPGTDVVL